MATVHCPACGAEFTVIRVAQSAVVTTKRGWLIEDGEVVEDALEGGPERCKHLDEIGGLLNIGNCPAAKPVIDAELKRLGV